MGHGVMFMAEHVHGEFCVHGEFPDVGCANKAKLSFPTNLSFYVKYSMFFAF